MNAAQLARFKLSTTGEASRQRRVAIITALQWTGRMQGVLKAWDGSEARAPQTAAELRRYMAALDAAKEAGKILTDDQRAEVEETAHAAGKVAQQITKAWPQIWSESET